MARTKKNAGKTTGGAAALPAAAQAPGAAPAGQAAHVAGSVGQMVMGDLVIHVHGAGTPGLVIHLHINGQGVASCS